MCASNQPNLVNDAFMCQSKVHHPRQTNHLVILVTQMHISQELGG